MFRRSAKRDFKSLSDEQIEKEFAAIPEILKARGDKAGYWAAAGVIAGGAAAWTMAALGLVVGGSVTLKILDNIKCLYDWINIRDLEPLIAERDARVKLEKERQKVLTPAAAEAFAASVGNGVKEDVKVLKPLTFRSRRRAGFNTAFQ